jgi:hypothetical protein
MNIMQSQELLRRIRIGLSGLLFIFTILALGYFLRTEFKLSLSSNLSIKTETKSNDPLAQFGAAPAEIPLDNNRQTVAPVKTTAAH